MSQLEAERQHDRLHDVLDAIHNERDRIIKLTVQNPRFVDLANPFTRDADRLRIIVEEIGEVARCLNESKDPKSELIQLGAAVVSWLEGTIAWEDYRMKKVEEGV